jgi:predicted HTH domain antitoxin
MNNFNRAIGCYVPYTSTIGIDILSMKKISDFLPGAANVSFERLSKLASSEFYTSIDVVRDEKFKLSVLKRSELRLFI